MVLIIGLTNLVKSLPKLFIHKYVYSRVAVGMGIPIGIPTGPTCGWEWEMFLAYGNSHMWESYGKSSFPHVGILWEIVIPTCGNPMVL